MNSSYSYYCHRTNNLIFTANCALQKCNLLLQTHYEHEVVKYAKNLCIAIRINRSKTLNGGKLKYLEGRRKVDQMVLTCSNRFVNISNSLSCHYFGIMIYQTLCQTLLIKLQEISLYLKICLP